MTSRRQTRVARLPWILTGVSPFFLFAAMACRAPATPTPPENTDPPSATQTAQSALADPPDVLLIIVDTLRADRLGCYGYDLPTSPNIDEFARHATLYERAYTTGAWTLPTHVSIFTGMFQFEHGVHPALKSEYDFKLRGKIPTFMPTMPAEHVTLAGEFDRAGYETLAIVANAVYVTPRFGLDSGYRHFAIPKPYEVKRVQRKADAPQIIDPLIAWIENRESSQPYFATINLMDTHIPVNATPRDGLPGARKKPLGYQEILDYLDRPRRSDRPSGLCRTLGRQYDMAVATVDSEIQRLFVAIQATSKWDDTIVVITADHGEYLCEKGRIGHEGGLHDPVLRVPMIVKDRHQTAGRRVSDPASVVDLADLLWTAAIADVGATESPFPNKLGNHPVIAEDFYPLGSPFDEDDVCMKTAYSMILDGDMKAIFANDRLIERYDLSHDPTETDNLATDDDPIGASLFHRLTEFRSSRTWFRNVKPVPPPGREERSALKYLGYTSDDE
jgi:hypothetical protein